MKLGVYAGLDMLLASLAAAPSPAQAGETDASSLQKEVEQLKQEVQTLKEQVKSLQETPSAAAAPSVAIQPEPTAAPQPQSTPTASNSAPVAVKPAADSVAELRVSWSQVDKGMTKAQIASLLGPPTRELTIDGKLVWYYYYPRIGGSSVFFNGDGRVSSKQRPTVGWW